MRVGKRMKEILKVLEEEDAPIQMLWMIVLKIKGSLPNDQKDRDYLWALYSRARDRLRKYGLIEHRSYRLEFDYEKRPDWSWRNSRYLDGDMIKDSEITAESAIRRVNKIQRTWKEKVADCTIDHLVRIERMHGEYPNVKWETLELGLNV